MMEEKIKVEKKKITKERKIERELLYILGFGVFLIILFFAANSYFKSLNTFEYQGLTFTKTKTGNIPLYYYSYYFNAPPSNKLYHYNLYLKVDPRENNATVAGDKIIFDRGKTVYITINSTGLQECENSVIAVADLSRFIADNQLQVKGGNPDFWEAGNKKQEWVTCENKQGKEVIEIMEGDETKIDINSNCHKITVNNCETLQATEKFILQSIIDAKESDDVKLR